MLARERKSAQGQHHAQNTIIMNISMVVIIIIIINTTTTILIIITSSSSSSSWSSPQKKYEHRLKTHDKHVGPAVPKVDKRQLREARFQAALPAIVTGNVRSRPMTHRMRVTKRAYGAAA